MTPLIIACLHEYERRKQAAKTETRSRDYAACIDALMRLALKRAGATKVAM